MAEKIGFIGLGIMGKPMARNLMEAGYELVVYNRSRGKVDELAEEGAEAAGSPREVAEQSDVVITMLPDSPEVREIVAGEDGVFEGIKEGSLLIDMSTISPVVTEELVADAGKKGVGMLDAPVSGGEPGTGEIHYPYVLSRLKEFGYGGYVGLEYNPTTETTEESLAWLPAELRSKDVTVEDLRLY